MSSSGIQSLSSGPLIIRTYNDTSSTNLTYILKDYDRPVSSNYVLITSTNGQLVPSDNIYVSSITTSSYNSDSIQVSTAYLSSIFGFSPVQFYSPVRINNTNPPTDGAQLFVNGSTVFSEPGAQSTTQIAGVTIWGLPNGNPIYSSIETSQTIHINEPLSKINFQLIGSGGTSTFSNPLIINQDNPGYGAYIAGTLKVKQGDKLQFFIGTLSSNGSTGTSLVYFSSINNGTFISTLVCVAGSGGDNGFSPDFISSSSGGGHGGGASGGITTSGNIDFYAFGTDGFDGLSTINNNFQSFTDGGQGGQREGGLGGGGNAGTGQNSSINNLLINGGLVLGGSGGNDNTKHGGYGGGGYTGGGGGEAGLTTSAGGGGGSSYIAISTLSNYLSNVICLGGQWMSQNNATPFGQNYGLPNNPGFAQITGYEPNDTLYTNGDIECRVLRYEMLDPPINAIGGQSALWSLYPAIDIVHMNDNPILECGGIHIDSGGADIKNIVNIRAGSNDTLDTSGFISQFIRTSSSGTYTIDYQVASDSTGFDSNTWQDARYVYNPENSPPISQVWGIVTSSNITPIGSTIGDIHFYKSVYVDGNVGIGTIHPTTNLQIIGTTSTNNLITSSITTNNSLSITAPNISIIGNLNVTSSLNVTDDLQVSNTIISQSTILLTNRLRFNFTTNDNTSYIQSGDGTGIQNSSGNLFIGNWLENTTNSSRKIMFLTNGNVGIGTINPTTNLQIIGTTSTNNLITSSITTNNLITSSITTNNLITSSITTNNLITSSIATNNSLSITAPNISIIGNLNVTSSLNVTDDLQVSNTIISQSTILLTNRLRFNFTTNDNTSYIQSGDGTGIQNSSGNLFIGNWLENTTASSRKIMFLANGNVGIGTATPQTTLDVIGNIHTSGYLSTNTIQMNNGEIIGLSTINGVAYSPDDINWTENGNNIYNNNIGNVGIGISTPQAKLDVNGLTNTTSLSINSILQPSIIAYGSYKWEDGPQIITLRNFGCTISNANVTAIITFNTLTLDTNYLPIATVRDSGSDRYVVLVQSTSISSFNIVTVTGLNEFVGVPVNFIVYN
jgi:hypothetical protein